jgi:tetratricopeptide (TPR) repeat protein
MTEKIIRTNVKDMATQKKQSVSREQEIGEIVSKSEAFIEKNQKLIIYVVSGIALLAAVIFGVLHIYIEPQEEQAKVALFKGEQYFAKDSFALALHGNGSDYRGFLSVIDKYGITRSANLARAYAGICYYRMGEPDKAMEMLKQFKSKEKLISPVIIGLIGDCYVNSGNYKEGIAYFEKASRLADNELFSPLFLKKAGAAYEELKQYDAAVKAYTTIKEKYFNSEDASDIDKYITRAAELSSK